MGKTLSEKVWDEHVVRSACRIVRRRRGSGNASSGWRHHHRHVVLSRPSAWMAWSSVAADCGCDIVGSSWNNATMRSAMRSTGSRSRSTVITMYPPVTSPLPRWFRSRFRVKVGKSRLSATVMKVRRRS